MVFRQAGEPHDEERSMVVAVKARVEDAAVSGFIVACLYVFVSSVALLFLPDAGRGSPSNLLVAGAVFVVAFVVSAVRSMHVDQPSWRAAPEQDVTATLISVRPLADVRYDAPRPAPAADTSPDPRAPQSP
jgi:hypothetical protein